MEVTGNWIKQHVSKLYGLFDVDTMQNYIDMNAKYQTTLTYKGIKEVESGNYHKRFSIIFPGHGIVNARGYEN